MIATKAFGTKGLLILLSLLFWLSASASPISAPETLEKRKPGFPSLQDCKDKFTAPAKDKAMYFTGLTARADVNKAKKYAEDHSLVHVGLSYPTGWTNPGNYDGTDKEKRAWQENFSKLYADATKGIAYLMLDDDKTVGSNSIFGTVEFPAMKDGAQVDKILQFPFTKPPSDPTKVTKEFWPDDAGAAALDAPPGEKVKRFWSKEDGADAPLPI